MLKTTQINQKVFLGIALALLSFSASLSDAVYVPTSSNICTLASASAEFTAANSVASSTACGAACSASFNAINAVKDANSTACNEAHGDQRACDTMKLYVQASTDDSKSQTFEACKASMKGTTACNAAYSQSYIACNAAHKTDYDSCNKALLAYVKICDTPGTSQTNCTLEYVKAKASCQSTANQAHSNCVAGATKAKASC